MSSRGNRRPAHQNQYAFRHNKNSRKTRMIESLPIEGVCPKCTEILEWRKRYRKYKPRTAPGKCRYCDAKAVRHAYHVICLTCAQQRDVCAKCLTSSSEAHADADEVGEDELARAVEGLRERERRTVLRNGLSSLEMNSDSGESTGDSEGGESDIVDDEKPSHAAAESEQGGSDAPPSEKGAAGTHGSNLR